LWKEALQLEKLWRTTLPLARTVDDRIIDRVATVEAHGTIRFVGFDCDILDLFSGKSLRLFELKSFRKLLEDFDESELFHKFVDRLITNFRP
jgi:hypothetical protein